jgi:hypothetical protein
LEAPSRNEPGRSLGYTLGLASTPTATEKSNGNGNSNSNSNSFERGSVGQDGSGDNGVHSSSFALCSCIETPIRPIRSSDRSAFNNFLSE